MKKLIIVFLFFIFLFSGIVVSSSNEDLSNKDLSDRLEQFEGEIVLPGNDYVSIKDKEIDPNVVGKIGQKIEGIIDKAFDAGKKILRKFID